MNYDLAVITQRSEPIVSTAEAKLHLRVETDMNDDDLLIASLVTAASNYCEMYTRRTVLETSYKMVFDTFPYTKGLFYLPRSPLVSLDQIQYYDEDGTLQTLSTDIYIVGQGISSPARIALAPDEEWPDTEAGRIEAVEVTFSSGEDVARDTFKAAIKLLVGHWYENRESVIIGATPAQVPQTVNMILDGEKITEVP